MLSHHICLLFITRLQHNMSHLCLNIHPSIMDSHQITMDSPCTMANHRQLDTNLYQLMDCHLQLLCTFRVAAALYAKEHLSKALIVLGGHV